MNHLKAPVYQLKTISLFELIDTSTGINQLLLAREERMAIAANIYLQNVAFFRRTRLKRSSTSASYSYFVIFGMNIRFHYFHLAVCFFFLCFPIIPLFSPLVNCFCLEFIKNTCKFKENSLYLFYSRTDAEIPPPIFPTRNRCFSYEDMATDLSAQHPTR